MAKHLTDTFRIRGYVVVPNPWSDSDLVAFRNNVDRAFNVIDRPDPGRAGTPHLLTVHQGVDKACDGIFDAARDNALLAVAAMLSERPVVPLSVDFYRRSAGTDMPITGQQLHSRYQGHFEDEVGISFWIFVGPQTDPLALEFGNTLPAVLLPHCMSERGDYDRALIAEPPTRLEPVLLASGYCVAQHSYAIYRLAACRSDPWEAFVLNYRTSKYRAWLQDREHQQSI